MCGERDCETPGRDGKDDIQKAVERMRGVSLCSSPPVRSRSSLRRLFPLRRNARRSDAPAKRGRTRPRETSRLSFGAHRLLHAARIPSGFNEAGRVARSDRAGSRRAGDLRLNDTDCDRQGIGERLCAQQSGIGARPQRRDRHQFAHPIENDNCNPMRDAKSHCLDRDNAAPSGHDDCGRHARARIVSNAALAVANNERAALDGKARAIIFRRDDARFDLKPGFPKGVAFRIGRRVGYGSFALARLWGCRERRLSGSQHRLPRRSCVRPRGCLGVSAIDGRAWLAGRKPRQRRGKVYRVTARFAHAA